MQKIHYASALLLIASLFGCSDKARPVAVAPASDSAPAVIKPEASKDALMQAVFGARYRVASKDALADLPIFEERDKTTPFVIKPLATSQLPGEQTVLVTQANVPLKPGQDEPNYNDISGLVSVYVLRETAGKWLVVKRHESLVYRGYADRPGSVLFLKLGKGKPGLAIMYASMDEGCSEESLHLYDLSEDSLRDLANIHTGTSANGGCGGDEKFTEEWTTSKWHLTPSKNAAAIYDDVVIAMSEERTPYAKEGEEKSPPPLVKKFTARYGYDGKRYKLIGGENPIYQSEGD